ncbi:hypothetical protein [Bradyrhizobium sp. CCGB01]|uniref:hypothetical protein n=1 Tax=Bradyrhizobium sp. CCGB01 TaxID=2949634 RepID=UPI0020B38ACD|nr:hypothetical protein [Bradyrhizobium sp. CCGB01]MCP3409929.1 hypothetical protein [Bradyrhizobium sp. CCGB01]
MIIARRIHKIRDDLIIHVQRVVRCQPIEVAPDPVECLIHDLRSGPVCILTSAAKRSRSELLPLIGLHARRGAAAAGDRAVVRVALVLPTCEYMVVTPPAEVENLILQIKLELQLWI